MENFMQASPAGRRAAEQPTITREPGAVLFLNPHILLMEARVVIGFDPTAASTPNVGALGAARPMRNPGPEQFNRLCEALKPSVVLTCQVDQYDPRSKLDNIGVRCRYAVDEMSDRGFKDRGSAIADWLAQHGYPPAMVLERGRVGIQGVTSANFSDRDMLTSAVVDRLIGAWSARAR